MTPASLNAGPLTSASPSVASPSAASLGAPLDCASPAGAPAGRAPESFVGLLSGLGAEIIGEEHGWSDAERRVIAHFLSVTHGSRVTGLQTQLTRTSMIELWRGAVTLPGADLTAEVLGLTSDLTDPVEVRRACETLADTLRQHLTGRVWPDPAAGWGQGELDSPLLARAAEAVCRALAAHLVSLYTLGQAQTQDAGAPRSVACSTVYGACPNCGGQDIEAWNADRPRRRADAENAGAFAAWSLTAAELHRQHEDHPGPYQLGQPVLPRLHHEIERLWTPWVSSVTLMNCQTCGQHGPALGFVLPEAGLDVSEDQA